MTDARTLRPDQIAAITAELERTLRAPEWRQVRRLLDHFDAALAADALAMTVATEVARQAQEPCNWGDKTPDTTAMTFDGAVEPDEIAAAVRRNVLGTD